MGLFIFRKMGAIMTYDYYYGVESESFSFYRIPRLLVTEPQFRGLSSDAKLLYGLLLDRMSLSRRNGWLDEQDRVYIYYTLDEIEDDMNCGHDKATKLLRELEPGGYGLIERVKQGLGKPARIYVKKFTAFSAPASAPADNRAHDSVRKSSTPERGKPAIQTAENPHSRLRESRGQDCEKAAPSYINNNQTYENQTYKNYTDPSIYPSDMSDRLDMTAAVKEQIEYDVLADRFPYGIVESLLTLITDVLQSTAENIRIGGSDIPIRLVKERFRQLDRSHIEYAIDSLDNTTTKINNIRAYLLTVLYNAPVTIDPFYAAAVRHDFG